MAHSLAALLVSRALIGAAAGCFLPAARAIVAGFDPARAGENLGRLARVDLAGFSSGPIIGGVLFSIVGLRGTFVFFAVVAAVALVVLAPRPLPTLATAASRPGPASASCATGGSSWRRCSPSRCSSPSGCSTRCGTAT